MKKKQHAGIMSLFIIVLLASLIAGCAQKPTNEPQNTSGGNGQAAGSGTPSEPAEKPAEPVEISLACFDCDMIAKSADDPIYQLLQEKLNIKLKVLASPYNNYNDKLNVMIASSELPDLFFGNGIGAMEQYQTWIKEDLLLPLSEVSGDYPHLERLVKRFELYGAATGGKLYGLPVSSYIEVENPVYNDHVLYIRQDWLDKLELQKPTTIDEFYAVAKAFAENDPDGNQKRDTFGYSSADGGFWWHYPLFNAFGTSFDRYKKIDGEWVPELIQEETKETVKFLHQLYQEKIMDPEFMINNGDQLVEKFVAGKVGMIFKNGSGFYNTIYEKFKLAYPDKDPKTMFTYGAILAGRDGEKRLDGFGNFWLFSFVNNQSSEAKKQKALELLDFLASEEGIALMRWGIEGVHYKKEGDQFVSLLPTGEDGTPKSLLDVAGTSRLKTLITWDSGFIAEDTPNKEEVIEAGREGINHSNADPLFGMFIDSAVLPVELGKTAGDYMEETIVKMIARSQNIEADWDSFVQSWLSKGGQRIWEETNKQALEEDR